MNQNNHRLRIHSSMHQHSGKALEPVRVLGQEKVRLYSLSAWGTVQAMVLVLEQEKVLVRAQALVWAYSVVMEPVKALAKVPV